MSCAAGVFLVEIDMFVFGSICFYKVLSVDMCFLWGRAFSVRIRFCKDLWRVNLSKPNRPNRSLCPPLKKLGPPHLIENGGHNQDAGEGNDENDANYGNDGHDENDADSVVAVAAGDDDSDGDHDDGDDDTDDDDDDDDENDDGEDDDDGDDDNDDDDDGNGGDDDDEDE